MRDYPPEYDEERYDNEVVKKAFADYDSPYQVYRSTYKYTACGPSVGFQIKDTCSDRQEVKWYYCDDLRKLGTWEDMDKKGLLVLNIHVSSIVEGVDETTGSHEVPCSLDALEEERIHTMDEQGNDTEELHETLARVYHKAVDDVDKEADGIWQSTHGCETCAKHWAGDPNNWTEDQWQVGLTNIWSDCPDCGGSGAII